MAMTRTNTGLPAHWRSWTPQLLSVIRIVTGSLFLQFGTTKLFGFPAAVMPGGGTAELFSLADVAGVLETFGGLLVLVGLLTRPVAFVLSGLMAFAYFIGHAHQGFWPVLNGGGPGAQYCFLFLFLSGAGAGPWSLDALLDWSRRTSGVAIGHVSGER
jgi:putative oxidoreductase